MEGASAIIVAGGAGKRMGAGMRKQYLRLGGLPVLSRTLLAVDACPMISRICLVVPKEDHDYIRRHVLSPIPLRSEIQMISGGEKRQASVYNGLSALTDTGGVVIIHDGVRPFITVNQIEACICAAKEAGACILGIPVSDTLKSVKDAYISSTPRRDCLWLAQTPQGFAFELIQKAHENALAKGFSGTDDASLVEYSGHRVKVIRGSSRNIKITTPEDLRMAEAILGLPEFREY